jgi:hypothetical protein
MPRYQFAQPFDIVRSIKNLQIATKQLQVQASSKIKQTVNQVQGSLNANPYFWGLDTTGWVAFNGTFVTVSDPPSPSPYPYAGFFTIGTAGAGAAMEQSSAAFFAVPLQSYLLTAWVYTPTTSVSIGYDWRDSSGTYISSSTQTITVSANTWTLVSTQQIAPSNAASGYPRLAPTDAVGNTLWATSILVNHAPNVTVQPGSSPAVAETWHDLPSGINGWGLGTGGWKKYRLTRDGDLGLSISLRLIGTKTDGTAIFGSGALPTGYQVSTARRLAISTTGNALSANSTPWIGLLSDGSMNINGVNTAGTLSQVDLHGVFPLI